MPVRAEAQDKWACVRMPYNSPPLIHVWQPEFTSTSQQLLRKLNRQSLMVDKTVINALLKEALGKPIKLSCNHDLTVCEPRPHVWKLQK